MKICRSYIWAAVITLGVAGWLTSGELIDAKLPQDAPAAATPTEDALPVAVRVIDLTAERRAGHLSVNGRTEADQSVVLRAETAGRVVATPHDKGEPVARGALICEVALGEREARLAEAMAAVAQAQLDHDAAVSLKQKGFAAVNDAAARKARLDAATAQLRQTEIDIERTRTVAPTDGIVAEVAADVGVWLSAGEPCATIVDLDPMMVVGHVSEREVGKLALGMAGTAELVTGESIAGRISYIAPTADAATRTFRIELEVANADLKLRDGVTARIDLALEPVAAHHFSPAILVLNDKGEVGVRIVGARDEVAFVPVTIIADGADGVWVTGLAPNVRVIAVGQDYVTDGQTVRPMPASVSG